MDGEARPIVTDIAALKIISAPVGAIDDGLLKLLADMRASLGPRHVGISAIQVGVPLRACVVRGNVDLETGEYPYLAMLNPEIIWKSPEKENGGEGCLSMPGFFKTVRRPKRIAVRYMGRDGTVVEERASGLMARIIQHEVDHMDGILITDRSKGKLAA